jgi:Xaa-Pro aminopeptidase
MLKVKLTRSEGVLITKPENKLYESGFTGSFGFVLYYGDKKEFVTDFRYKKQVQEQCKDFDIKMVNKTYRIFEYIKDLNLDTLYIEKSHITVDFIENLSEISGISNFKSIDQEISNSRMIKSDVEIAKMRKAQSIADDAFDHILTFIKEGVTEREIAAELEYHMVRNGASGKSFNTIVASGLRSSMPHGVATDKKVEKGDFITMDFGCVYQGYCSDMTRTIVLGKASDRQKEIYNTVLKAQLKAFDLMKAGAKCSDIDSLARDVIESSGYGEFFGHGLGHGVGLEVHETPYLSKESEDVLKSGMVVTNEPGIYINDFGGVRIEDIIYITDSGYDILSRSTKELIEL